MPFVWRKHTVCVFIRDEIVFPFGQRFPIHRTHVKYNGAFFQMLHYIYLTAIISISTSAPFGKSRTAKAERAG